MSVPRLRNYEGPRRRPIHSAFFLLGSIYSGAVIPLWLGVFAGDLVPTSFAPRYWHVDEMLLGYVATILGGFSTYGGSELDRTASAAGHAARARLHLSCWTERGRLNVVDRMTAARRSTRHFPLSDAVRRAVERLEWSAPTRFSMRQKCRNKRR